MDEQKFDEFAMTVADGLSRRSLGRLVAGGALGAVAGRLGLAAPAAAGRRRRRRCDGNNDCRGSQICSTNGRCVAGDRCGDLVPPCAGCQEPRCDTATGQYVCTSKCDEEAGEVCCNGLCEPPCTNGCRPNPGEAGCACTKPPDGEVYCAESNRCGENPCPIGHEYDQSTCTCECPAGAIICAGVPETYWPHLGRRLPAGCCPPEKWVVWHDGRTMCAEPVSGGTGWWCN